MRKQTKAKRVNNTKRIGGRDRGLCRIREKLAINFTNKKMTTPNTHTHTKINDMNNKNTIEEKQLKSLKNWQANSLNKYIKTLCLLCFKFSATWPLSRNK